jgi:iron complex outermembrane receptor protein
VYGFEVLADAYLTRNLTIGASYSKVEGKIDGNNNGSFDDKEDRYLPGNRIAPAVFTAYSKVELSDLSIRLQMLNSGKRKHFKATNDKFKYGEGPVDAFTVFHLTSSYKVNKDLNVKLGIENLFNEDYYSVVSMWGANSNSYIKSNGTRFNLGLDYTF